MSHPEQITRIEAELLALHVADVVRRLRGLCDMVPAANKTRPPEGDGRAQCPPALAPDGGMEAAVHGAPVSGGVRGADDWAPLDLGRALVSYGPAAAVGRAVNLLG